ncbi:hypothetical protein F383_00514 [Gossypium arboreum]|uniref:Uncharacterized protein n=1 Tax=Gossypium arboreum TaxID=29729 RepID=A0A0B0NVB2_GOSAR|nr:hypothetical protein F383_00514 [Gossypium arboreum]
MKDAFSWLNECLFWLIYLLELYLFRYWLEFVWNYICKGDNEAW